MLDMAPLKKARWILNNFFCKWTVEDRMGNHCAIGAVSMAVFGHPHAFMRAPASDYLELLDGCAERLHPELKHARGRRSDSDTVPDLFDLNPLVYVNNQLGREAALAVFDEALLMVELGALYKEQSGKPPDPEPTPKPKEPVEA